MTTINPYLTFNGNCEEAFSFYASVFGSETPAFMRFKGMYSEDEISGGDGEKIMHVALPIGDGVLMGSDTLESMGRALVGSNFNLSLQVDSQAEADRFYNALSVGGKVTMPMAKAPWGDYFGMLIDKFDIEWMINHVQNQA